MKTCPACKKQSGPRTKQCECGHNFASTPAPVAASAAPMTKADPLNDRLDVGQTIKDTISSAKTILQKVDSRRSLSVPEPWDDPDSADSDEVSSSKPIASGKVALKEQQQRPGYSRVYVPAGECPFKPEGYKSGYERMSTWPEPASPEVIQNWAVRVFNSGNYHPHAVVYWARYFWEMQDVTVSPDGTKVFAKEWNRVRDLILEALTPVGSNHEPVTNWD